MSNFLPVVKLEFINDKQVPAVTSQQLFDITGMTVAIFNAAGIVGNQQALALDKIVRKKTGDSPLELAEVQLEAPTKRQPSGSFSRPHSLVRSATVYRGGR